MFKKILLLLISFMLLLSQTALAIEICKRNPVPGVDECTFNAYDFSPSTPKTDEVTATCRRVTEHLYVFVQNGLWEDSANSTKVTPAKLDEIVKAFEDETPKTPTYLTSEKKGIYETFEHVGVIPDQFDHDKHIYLVIHDIKTTTKKIGAYFREVDLEKTYNGKPLDGSNQHETIFLDYDDVDGNDRLNELALVLLNMIHWGIDDGEKPIDQTQPWNQEEAWVKDVITRKFVMDLGFQPGSDVVAIENFAENPNTPLIGEKTATGVKLNTGAILLFSVFLNQRLQDHFFTAWILDGKRQGIDGFEHILQNDPKNKDKNFCDFLHEWTIQNSINQGDTYSYPTDKINLPFFYVSTIKNNPGSAMVEITKYAGSTVEIRTEDVPENTKLELQYKINDTKSIRVTAVKFDTNKTSLLDVEELTIISGQTTTIVFDDIYENYNRIYLVTSRCTEMDPMSYNVTTKIIEPPKPEDGDNEDSENAENADSTTTDGDSSTADGDGNSTTDGDDDGIVVYGDKDCHEINACFIQCNDKICQNSCISEGDQEAQLAWAKYSKCITGINPSSDDCTAYEKAEDRNRCLHVNCHLEVETCELLDPPDDITPDDIGSSSCNSGTGYPSFIVFLLGSLILAIMRTRKKNHERG